MKKIHRVIYQEVLPPWGIALGVLTFVVFTREFGRLVELLIRKDADPFTVFQVVVSLLPAILIFTFPISFLVGTLVGFSRLSTESEIVAMRAGGIGVYQILRPVLKVALLVMAGTFLLTLVLLPEGNWKLRQLRQEIGLRPVQSQVRPRVFNEDLPGKILYVEDIDIRTQAWDGVFLADQSEDQKRIVLARRGLPLLGEESDRVQLVLTEGMSYEFQQSNPRRYSLSSFGELDVLVNLPEMEPVSQQPKRYSDKRVGELWEEVRGADPSRARRSRVEIQRRLALPLSALVFAVLGVTLGISSHRGGRGYGSIVSMAVAFLYYILFATGSELSAEGALHPLVGVWGGNLLLGSVALVSLREARRGQTLVSAVGGYRPMAAAGRLLHGARQWVSRHTGRLAWRLRKWLWGLSSVRLRVAQVIDLYLLRLFGYTLLLTLAVCVALFYLFTFFELVDDVYENGIAWPIVLEYFVYLAPQVLMLLIPISILIATMITFGILEKTSQVVAFRASGVSLYRLSLPVLAMGALISLAVFLTQDQILPYANQRQDSLRDRIKGHPAQTHYYPGRNWIFGRQDRLYNYNYYDPDRRVFAELSILEIDIGASRLLSHTYAQRATWDPFAGRWNLTRGWRRDFTLRQQSVSTFETQMLQLAETPDYFVQEVKESSKMTSVELAGYVGELQQAGFEVDHLRTELYRKFAFPLVSLLMVFLGIPFAFSIGRKGALYGVAAGTLLGIAYWGAFGVFGVLGGSGLLSPLLSAWAPNLLFGSASLYLYLSVKT